MRLPIETRMHRLIDDHPLAAGLSAEAERLWLRVARAIQRAGGLDTFHLRQGIATLGELAAWFRISVTEAARAFDELIRRGCLLVVEGGFRLPDWSGVASRKAVSARENGRKRCATTVQPHADKQRRLPLLASITGGRRSVTDATTTTTTSENQSSLEVVVADEPSTGTDAAVIAQELGEIVGLTEAQARRSAGQVNYWLQKGITVKAMRDVVGRVLQRPNLPPITGLGYFDGAIRDLARAAPPALAAPTEAAVNPELQRARRAWQERVLAWRDGGCVGRPPRLEDFVERERRAAA